MGVRELDLSDCHVNSLSDKINAVPGLRTSTGEFLIFISNMSTYLVSLLGHPPLHVHVESTWTTSLSTKHFLLEDT